LAERNEPVTESTTSFAAGDLFALLGRSGLLNDKLFEAQRQRFQIDNATTKSILSQMLSEHLLTTFQARQLGERRHRGFFLTEKYKILEFLGQGGMSRVLLCEHLLLQRLVAVKVLNKSLDKFPGAAERFLREARASAAMDHPNIARVFDVDRTSLGPCIVMEYVDGTNLHDIAVKRDLLSINRVAHYISQAATGLQQAHQAGLVHRDVKPANLMLDRTGTVKLLDLGLARFFDPTRSDNLTQQIDSSSIIGTADYIAPEQVMESSSVDIRADIYSLGYSMYFLLTRTLPAGTGPSMRKLLWHQTRDPEPIRNLRPEVPEELAAVLEQMIRKRPEDRYQTPADVVAALKPWISEPIDRPSDEEMPRTKAIAYRLGLCPPPDSSKVAGATVSFATTRSSARSNPGSSSVRGTPGRGTDSDSQTAGESTIGYTNPPAGSSSSSTTGAAIPSTKTHEVMSAATGTDATSASAFGRQQAESERPTNRSWVRNVIAVLGMLVVLGLGGWGFRHWSMLSRPVASNHQPETTVVAPAGDDARSISPAAATPSAPVVHSTGMVLRGGGSTFIRPLLERWSTLYEKRTGVKIEYSAVGSSKGVDGLLANFLDFGCTDACLSDEQLSGAGSTIVHIPLVVGAIAATYNLGEVLAESSPLRFTGPTLANIYLGKIRKWNHPSIAVSNPGRDLPDLEITVVYRKDGSGTTAIWTDYLSKTSSAWRTQIGTGNKVVWPVGIGVEKNDGMADAVSRTVGAIGYVELGYALANGLAIGQVKNQSGAFVEPCVDGITAAMEAFAATVPADLRYSLTDATGVNSYPIVGTCWAVLHGNQTSERGIALVQFLRWATTEGQSHVGGFPYGRLPIEFADRIDAMLDGIESVK
jgi:phosphate ABC transporter phosphate-binding protein